MVEIINLFLGQVKKKTVVGRLSGTQDKYLSKVKDEYISTISNAYEPLIEKHIGHKEADLIAPRKIGLVRHLGE